MHPSPTNDEFMGMTEYSMESFHDLLKGDSESLSDSDSSRGSHHPSQECFMAGTLERRIESVTESLHSLLTEELGSDFGSDSSRGSHHPSQDCFMMVPLRGTSKASPWRRLPQRATSAAKPKGRQRPHLG